MKLALSTLCENPSSKTGLTTFFREFVEHSLDADASVSWLVFADSRSDWQPASSRVTINRWFPGNQRTALRLISDHLLLPAVAKAHGADALVTVGFVPLVKPLPVAMHLLVFNTAGPSAALRSRYREWMMRRGLRAADVIITNSQWSASRIRSCHRAAARMLVSYEGLQHDLFHPRSGDSEAPALHRQFGLDPGYLLWVSNFYPYKQPELLLSAYARLPAAERRTAPLVMAGGSWGGGIESAKRLAASLGIEPDVRFLGWTEDRWLPLLYRHAGAFCLASREETFGRCVVEAMACGAVCVLNDIPSLREVTAGHALFVDFRDSRGAAEQLRRALFASGDRARIRSAGLERAGQFSFDTLARERLRAIGDIVPRPSSHAARPPRGRSVVPLAAPGRITLRAGPLHRNYRVLKVHNRYQQVGGEDISAQEESRMLAAAGHEVRIYEDSNHRIEQINPLIVGAATIWNPASARRLDAEIARFRPDVVHFHNTFPLISPSAYGAARRHRVPVVQTLPNFRLLCPGGTFFRDGAPCEECLTSRSLLPSIRHACYRKDRLATACTATMVGLHWALGTWTRAIDVFVVPSQFARSKLLQGGIPSDRIVVKPNLLSFDPGIPSSHGDYALFAGRLTEGKGIRVLLDAWRNLPGVPLKIVGDGPLHRSAELPNVEWLGPVDHGAVIELMKGARLLIQPSLMYETFGRTVIEAMAVGLPSIASDLGALPELVAHRRNGLLFPPGDAAALVSAVRWTRDNPDEYQTMRRNARLTYEDNYTAAVNYPALMSIFETAIERARAGSAA